VDVHDIIYIDVPRFESLASQRMEGLTQITTISEIDQRGKGSTTDHGTKVVHEGTGHQVGSTREVQNLDHSFREFMEKISGDIVDITSIAPAAARAACESAITTGQFVRASGPFFYSDFKWLKAISDVWWKWQKSNHEMTPPTKEERTASDALKKSMAHTWMLSEFAFADALECGVALGQEDDGLLVKSVLGREHMRLSSEAFIGRYGTKTHCHFTMLGSVARLGWYGDVSIIETLAAVAGEEAQQFKKAIEGVQEMAVRIRRNMDGGDAHSVHLMPLAVFRTTTMQDDAEEPDERGAQE
jgi:hypothetical protein